MARTLDHALIQSELNGVNGRSSPQVVHSSLETLLPPVKVHGSQLSHGWVGQVNVQGLRLVDKGTTIGSEVDDSLLTDLPDGLVDRLELGRDTRDILDRSTVSNTIDGTQVSNSQKRCLDPATNILFFMSSSQRPMLTRSRNNQGQTTWNSPAKTRRV
jgi:hypothetical protein